MMRTAIDNVPRHGHGIHGRGAGPASPGQRRRLSDEVEAIAKLWDEMADWPMTLGLGHRSSVRRFLLRLPLEEVAEAVGIAVRKELERLSGHDARWRYFCGVCWRKIEARAIPAADADGPRMHAPAAATTADIGGSAGTPRDGRPRGAGDPWGPASTWSPGRRRRRLPAGKTNEPPADPGV